MKSRSQPPPSSQPPQPPLVDRPPMPLSRNAQLLLTVRELTAPADALSRRTRQLAENLPDEVQPAFASAVQGLALRSKLFRDLLHQALEPGVHGGIAIVDRIFRHELRGHAAYILGTCHLWQKKAGRLGLERYFPKLSKIHAIGQHAVDLLDRLSALAGNEEVPAHAVPIVPRSVLSPMTSCGREVGRILVVDDNPFNRELLREVLTQFGHEIVEAASGQQALELLTREAVDLVLLDVMMPDLDGLTVLERLKADPTTRAIPVIMISSFDQVDSVVGCLTRGAEDYLIRPCPELMLQARLGATLERKRLRDREQKHLEQIDQLLQSIFPPELVPELKETRTIRPRRFEQVGVLFLDLVGFTNFCESFKDRPEHVVEMLQHQVLRFEQASQRHGVRKIKTIGDAFMAVAGLLRPCPNPVLSLLRCAVELNEVAREGPVPWVVRIGIHVGPVVAGKLGESQYAYDLWGPTVNLAARMESSARPGGITLSDEAWQQVEAYCLAEPREVAVRGIGLLTVWDFKGFRT